MWRLVHVALTGVSGERIASIFREEEKRRKSASEELACRRLSPFFFYLEDGGYTFLRKVC
jgi:hypothetical protein